MNESRPHDDDSTDTEPAAYTVHHIPESAAERAVDRFNRKAALLDEGEDVAASGTLYVFDTLLDEVDDTAVFLVDGEPAGEWLNGRIDRMKVTPGDD